MGADAARRPHGLPTVLGTLTIALALLVAGCASGDPPAGDPDDASTFPPGSFAIVANSDIGVGRARILVGVVSEDGRRLGSADDDVRLAITHGDGSGTMQEVDAVWTWIVEPAFGVWRAEVDLPRAGPWQVTVLPDHGTPPTPALFEARTRTIAPNIGEMAPAPDTPTIASAPIEALTTDPEPDLRFYRSSLASLIADGTETVVVFSTPAYCTTSACGPLLDLTKQIAPEYPDIAFVHIEVYTGFDQPGFVPTPGALAPAVGPSQWNLPSEPWLFVIDDRGFVTARFEGVMASEELRGALDSL